MLTYNKSAWHYKLLLWAWGVGWSNPERTIPTNLCPYMRKLLATIILLPGIAVWRALPEGVQNHPDLARGSIIWLSIAHLAGFGVNGLMEIEKDPQIWWLGWGIFLGGYLIVGFVIAIIFLSEQIKNKLDSRPPKEHQSIAIFKDYVAAKHDKICPQIQFVDNPSETH